MTNDPRLQTIIESQPYPLLFVTVSGAHLYGFPSPDSDYDLRGAHILPAREVLGLHSKKETIESSGIREGLELDLVTHDIEMYFNLMLRKNGLVLEQLYSPLVLLTSPEHEELKQIGHGCATKFHSYHYLGFADTQWKLFDKERPRRVKPLLYVYRVLLTGIHLMRTGIVEPNLLTLNQEYKLPYIDDLVQRKLAGPEKAKLPDADIDFHRGEYESLVSRLKAEHETSQLPDVATSKDALSDLLVRLRMKTLG